MKIYDELNIEVNGIVVFQMTREEHYFSNKKISFSISKQVFGNKNE